jgi:hypothetical protein
MERGGWYNESERVSLKETLSVDRSKDLRSSPLQDRFRKEALKVKASTLDSMGWTLRTSWANGSNVFPAPIIRGPIRRNSYTDRTRVDYVEEVLESIHGR